MKEVDRNRFDYEHSGPVAFSEKSRVYIFAHIHVAIKDSFTCVPRHFEAVSLGEFQSYHYNA